MKELELTDAPSTQTPKKSKRKKRIAAQKKGSVSIVQVPQSPKNNLDGKSHVKTKAAELSIYDQAASLLFHIIKESQHSPGADAIQQAYMYLQDLGIAHQALSKSSDHSVRSFYLISMIQSAYFTLEQLIRYQATQTKDDIKIHNLVHLIKEANLELKRRDTDLINELFLANYWVRQPYEQLAKRKSWTIPPVLTDIKEIFESKDSKSISEERIGKINTYIHSIPQFICSMPFAKKTESFTLNPANVTKNVKIFNLQIEFDKKIPEIVKKCKNIYSHVPYHLQPKFKQVISHLLMFSGILHELSQKHIPSDQFSFLIRSLVFWENTILEEMLETLHAIKTGDNFLSHRLDTLWRAIPWGQQPKEKHFKFLEENFYHVHNISRYPFSPSSNSNHPLHKIILRGETLRERPELGIDRPYQLVKGGKSSNQEDLTPKAIGTQIQRITHKVLNIIEKRLLPEFEASLANSTGS